MRSGGGGETVNAPPQGGITITLSFFGIDQKMAKGREWSMGQFTPAHPFPIGKNAQCEISLLYKIYNSIKMGRGPYQQRARLLFLILLFTIAPKPKA